MVCFYPIHSGGFRGGPGAPPGPKFSQFHAVFHKIWQNHMLAPPPPQEGWRPLLRGILDPALIHTIWKIKEVSLFIRPMRTENF